MMLLPYKWFISFLVDLGYMIEIYIIAEEKTYTFSMSTKDIKILRPGRLQLLAKLKETTPFLSRK